MKLKTFDLFFVLLHNTIFTWALRNVGGQSHPDLVFSEFPWFDLLLTFKILLQHFYHHG
jgi:hypothetical protein